MSADNVTQTGTQTLPSIFYLCNLFNTEYANIDQVIGGDVPFPVKIYLDPRDAGFDFNKKTGEFTEREPINYTSGNTVTVMALDRSHEDEEGNLVLKVVLANNISKFTGIAGENITFNYNIDRTRRVYKTITEKRTRSIREFYWDKVVTTVFKSVFTFIGGIFSRKKKKKTIAQTLTENVRRTIWRKEKYDYRYKAWVTEHYKQSVLRKNFDITNLVYMGYRSVGGIKLNRGQLIDKVKKTIRNKINEGQMGFRTMQSIVPIKDHFLYNTLLNMYHKEYLNDTTLAQHVTLDGKDVYASAYYTLKKMGIGDMERIVEILNTVDAAGKSYSPSGVKNYISSPMSIETYLKTDIKIKSSHATHADIAITSEGSGMELVRSSAMNLKNNFDIHVTVPAIRNIVEWTSYGSYITGMFEDMNTLNYVMDSEGKAILEVLEAPPKDGLKIKEVFVKAGQMVNPGDEIMHLKKGVKHYKIKTRYAGRVQFTNAMLKSQGFNGMSEGDYTFKGMPVAFIYHPESFSESIDETNPWANVLRGERIIYAHKEGYLNLPTIHDNKIPADIDINIDGSEVKYDNNVFNYNKDTDSRESGMMKNQKKVHGEYVMKGDELFTLVFYDTDKPWLYQPLNPNYTLGTYLANSPEAWSTYQTDPHNFTGYWAGIHSLGQGTLHGGNTGCGVFKTTFFARAYDIMMKSLYIYEGRNKFMLDPDALDHLFLKFGLEGTLLELNGIFDNLFKDNFNLFTSYRKDHKKDDTVLWLKNQGLDLDFPDAVASNLKNDTMQAIYDSLMSIDYLPEGNTNKAKMDVVSLVAKVLMCSLFMRKWNPSDDGTIVDIVRDENGDAVLDEFGQTISVYLNYQDVIDDYKKLHEILNTTKKALETMVKKTRSIIGRSKPRNKKTDYSTKTDVLAGIIAAVAVAALVIVTGGAALGPLALAGLAAGAGAMTFTAVGASTGFFQYK